MAEFSNLLLSTWTDPTKSNLLPNDVAYRFRLCSRLQINYPLKIDLLHHTASALGHQQMYNLERFYGTKVSFYKGTDSYKLYKLVQTPNFSVRLMP